MSDCGVCLYGDGEPVDVFISRTVRARKPWGCYECERPIAIGEPHQFVKMLYEGRWDVFRTCAVCAEIRAAFYCEGELIGEFWSQMSDYAFAEMNVSCLDKLTTVAAKQYLMQRWQEWKGLND